MNNELLGKLQPEWDFFQKAHPSRFGMEPPAMYKGDYIKMLSLHPKAFLDARVTPPREYNSRVKKIIDDKPEQGADAMEWLSFAKRLSDNIKDSFWLIQAIRAIKADLNQSQEPDCIEYLQCVLNLFNGFLAENFIPGVLGNPNRFEEMLWKEINYYSETKNKWLKARAVMRLKTMYYAFYAGQNSGEFTLGNQDKQSNSLYPWLFAAWTRPTQSLIAALNAAEDLLLKSFEPLVASIAPADDDIPQSKKKGE